MKEVRIDKWLWATRVFKTRTIATTACKLGRVTIGGMTVKHQLRLLEMVKIDGFVNRQRGMGRPTKKEGRELQDFTDEAFFGFDDPMPIDDAFDWDEEENPLWTQEDEERLNEDIAARRNKGGKNQ